MFPHEVHFSHEDSARSVSFPVSNLFFVSYFPPSPSLLSSSMSADFVSCSVWIVSLYSLVALLNIVVPGTKTIGYALDSKGKPLIYHLNGLRVITLVASAFIGKHRMEREI